MNLQHTNPVAILMAGLPGVGKSQVAADIARQFNICYLDKDDIQDFLKASSIMDPLEQGRVSYDVLFRLMECQLAAGVSVVVDTCYTCKWLRKRLTTIASASGAEHLVILCECPEDVARSRIQARIASDAVRYSERTWEEHSRIKDVFEPLDSIDLRLDTTSSSAENARQLSYLLLKRGSRT